MNRNYEVLFEVKPGISDSDIVDVRFEVVANNGAVAKAKGLQLLGECGESKADFKPPKVKWLKHTKKEEASTTGQRQGIDVGSQEPAVEANKESVVEPAPVDPNIMQPLIDEKEKHVAELKKSLPYAEGQMYFKQQREINRLNSELVNLRQGIVKASSPDTEFPVKVDNTPEDVNLPNGVVAKPYIREGGQYKPLNDDDTQEAEPVEPPPPSHADLVRRQVDKLNEQIAMLKPGERLRLENVPNEVYHLSNGWGSSGVKTVIQQCPGMVHAERTGQTERDDSKYVVGSATHDRLLLPAVFESDYVIQPKDITVRRGAKWDEFKATHADKTIITQDQHDATLRMRDVFLREFGGYFKDGAPEVSYWYHEPTTGLILKARPDYEIKEVGIDAKTTGSVNPVDVDRLFNNLGYYLQEGHYKLVTGLVKYIFVFISTKKPHPTLGPRDSGPALQELARFELMKAYKTIAYCEQMDDWQWFEDGYVQVEPDYKARKRLEAFRGER